MAPLGKVRFEHVRIEKWGKTEKGRFKQTGRLFFKIYDYAPVI
jgi:hypothetical protein